MMKLLIVFVLLFHVICTFSARILVIFPLPSRSHLNLGNAFVKELVNRKHDVTFISAYGSKLGKENVTDIIIPDTEDSKEEFQNCILELGKKSALSQFYDSIKLGEWIEERTLKSMEVHNLLKSNNKFDLVIMESFLSEAFVGFGHHFDCPVIPFSSLGSSVWINHYVGNPGPPSYVPQIMTDYTGDMNFWTRTKNFALAVVMEVLYNGFHLPHEDRILLKYFPNASSLQDVINKRFTVLLINSHPALNIAKPSVPNMIEIGGYHIPKLRPLPKDLKDYLDEAKEGFIYFSMGSVMKSIMLPLETRKIIIKVFAQLPYKILWKFEEDSIPNLPRNIKIQKWLPQNEILAHPNIKLFILHGGLLSTTEAIYHGVPIVGIPVFADQTMNMANAEALGIGKSLPLNKLTYEKLLKTLKEVLQNKKYTEAVKYRSLLLKDQPLHPMDLAMYWIDYVLRHKHTNHLRTGAVNLSWYQVRSIDSMAFLGSIIFLLYFTMKKLWKKLKCRINLNYISTYSEKKEN